MGLGFGGRQGRICDRGCLGCSPGRGPVQVNRSTTSRRADRVSTASRRSPSWPLRVSSSRCICLLSPSPVVDSWRRWPRRPQATAGPPPVVARCPGPVLCPAQPPSRVWCIGSRSGCLPHPHRYPANEPSKQQPHCPSHRRHGASQRRAGSGAALRRCLTKHKKTVKFQIVRVPFK